MSKWEIDTPLRLDGGYEDDEKADSFDAPDWVVWLKRPPSVEWKGRTRHMQIRFAREGHDRAELNKE